MVISLLIKNEICLSVCPATLDFGKSICNRFQIKFVKAKTKQNKQTNKQTKSPYLEHVDVSNEK